MEIKQKAIVLAASKYSFTDEKANKEVEGCSLYYIFTENLAPCIDVEQSVKGHKPVKASLPLEFYDKTQEVPGLYELDLRLQAGSDGKVKANVVDFKFIEILV